MIDEAAGIGGGFGWAGDFETVCRQEAVDRRFSCRLFRGLLLPYREDKYLISPLISCELIHYSIIAAVVVCGVVF